MAKTDAELGKRVRDHLHRVGLETLVFEPELPLAREALENGVGEFLSRMGLDVLKDDSINETPRRVAEMFTYELCAGLNYNDFPKCTVTTNGMTQTVKKKMVSTEEYEQDARKYECHNVSKSAGSWDYEYDVHVGKVDEMVMVRKIQTVSLCEHHFQTIRGHTYIAYIPGDKLLGVSKFARVTNFFARRPQVQERMTEQVYAALSFILGIEDIAVYQVASHNCMRARGAMEPESDMITSKMGGRFMTNQALRQEFLNAIPN